MSLQLNKIAVVDSLSYHNETWNNKIHKHVVNQWGDKATSAIHKSISNYNLIIFPFCESRHWFTFMFIRIDKKRFILIQIDSFKHEAQKGKSEELINWFNSSP